MAETREGGVYRVGDEWQDANGNKTDAPEAAEKKAGGAPEADPELSEMRGLFASEAAYEAAAEAGLTTADFKGGTPSSPNGYTKPDVQAIIDARGA